MSAGVVAGKLRSVQIGDDAWLPAAERAKAGGRALTSVIEAALIAYRDWCRVSFARGGA